MNGSLILACGGSRHGRTSGGFRCIVAVASPTQEVLFTEGICPGEIIPTERGANGFGYDPIFLLPELGKTMAELELPVKNTLSHRGRAVQAAILLLVKMLKNL